jgi:capsular polysaccharide biosynthesis protein
MSAAPALTLLEDYELVGPVTPEVFLRDRPEARTTPLAAALIPPTELSAWLSTRVGGAAVPVWRSGEGLGWRAETTVCRLRDVRWAPRSGAIVDRHGVVVRCTVGKDRLTTADLPDLPGFSRAPDGAPTLDLAKPPPAIPRATVWMPWGGGFNYGHFLIDGLCALLAVDEMGLLAEHPPVSPPLSPWQRRLLALAFPDHPVREVAAPVAEIDEVVFSTAMHHFLHTPNALLARLRDRILARAPEADGGGPRLYLSRRRTTSRVLLNERALERALLARGFRILHPETMTVDAQIAALRGAQVVVGASGAQLANAMFLPPGAAMIEIQPETFTSVWAPMLAWVTERDWAGYFAPAPEPAWRAPTLARLRRGFKFAWRLDLDDFLRFLDARL